METQKAGVQFNLLGRKRWLGPVFLFFEKADGLPGVICLWLIKRGLTGWLERINKVSHQPLKCDGGG